MFRRQFSYNLITFITAFYFATFLNASTYAEFNSYFVAQQDNSSHIGFYISFAIVLTGILNFVFSLFSWPYLMRPLFAVLIILSSIVNYAGLKYGILFTKGMIANFMETHSSEALAYFNPTSFAWILFSGVLPAILICCVPLQAIRSVPKFLLLKLGSMLGFLSLALLLTFFYFKDYASAFRNSDTLRDAKTLNPYYYILSTQYYIQNTYFSEPIVYKQIGLDAKQSQQALANEKKKPSLLVFIAGETARSQNYQLNGYPRPTNPYTKALDFISYQDVSSCGTATNLSLPCMFSIHTHDNFDRTITDNQDNVLDIMQRAGISLLWQENDGGDKSVAKNIQRYKIKPEDDNSGHCQEGVCQDMAMLEHFSEHLDKLTGNAVLVFHIIGSHGPTYHLRYPRDKAVFLPDCQRSDIENCTHEEIVNSYDNTILYTDYFIDQVVQKLKGLAAERNTALIYVSDHGESLGENGIYLHGLTYSLAPDFQKKVPFMLWLSDGFRDSKGINEQCLRQRATLKATHSHDNVFHSLLGVMDVQTEVYQKQLDIFAPCRH